MFLNSKIKYFSLRNIVHLSKYYKSYKFIPSLPTWTPKFYPKSQNVTTVDYETVYLLERLSLIDFGTSKSVQVLVDAINFVSDIKEVNVDNVEPKSRMWNDAELLLRNEDDEKIHSELSDTVGSVSQITQNSDSIFEDYFTAPIGNKPIEKDESKADIYNVTRKANN